MRDETKDDMRVLNPCSSSFCLLEAGIHFQFTPGFSPVNRLSQPSFNRFNVSLCNRPAKPVKTVPAQPSKHRVNLGIQKPAKWVTAQATLSPVPRAYCFAAHPGLTPQALRFRSDFAANLD